MKTTRNLRLSLSLLTMVIITALSSCHDDEIGVPHDYFPLLENTPVAYKKLFISTGDKSVWSTDTLVLSISGDTLIDGMLYKKFINQYGMIDKVVRREGNQYFGRNHELYGGFTTEYMFLDTDVPAGGSWAHIKDNGNSKTEYVVKEVNATHVIDGVAYKNVIKIDVNYYNNYDDGVTLKLSYSVPHYYASGIGEIYSYYPYPVSNCYCDVDISILSGSK